MAMQVDLALPNDTPDQIHSLSLPTLQLELDQLSLDKSNHILSQNM